MFVCFVVDDFVDVGGVKVGVWVVVFFGVFCYVD